MCKKVFKITYIFIIFFFAFHVFAALRIREVMYNPDGSDANREWVEIYNDGNNVDVSSWYFIENDTYHGLYPDGFTQLGQGEQALIVKDVAHARSSLGLSLKYIKSSFSLNNTGETIALADNDKNTVDSYSYQSTDGANGDGKSLQYIYGSWVASLPTPGAENIDNGGGSSEESNNGEEGDSSWGNDDIPEKINTLLQKSEPYYRPYIVLPETIVSQSNFDIEIGVDYIDDKAVSRELDGYFVVNFGDGKRIISSQKIKRNYRYRNPGKYVLVFTYYTSRLAYESGAEADAFFKKTIFVTDNKVFIEKVNSFDGVLIRNNTQKTVDISSWKIISQNHRYVFPEGSFIIPKNSISIIPSVLGFSPDIKNGSMVQLLSDAYNPISYFPHSEKKQALSKHRKIFHKKTSSIKKKSVKKEISLKEKVLDFKDLPDANTSFFGDTQGAYLDEYLAKHPDKLKVSFGDADAFEKHDDDNNKDDYSIYYVLGSLLIMLGVGRVMKHKYNEKISEVHRKEDYGSIEVIE